MSRDFLLPDLGEGIAEAQIVRVLVKPGDRIEEDQYLMEVETDKAAVEIPSPYAGVLATVHVKEGQTVAVGQPIVTFDDGAPAGKAAAPAPAAKAAPTPGAPVASAPSIAPAKTTAAAAPAVRKLARELNVNIDTIAGTGPGGRVTKEDVEAAASGRGAAAPASISPATGGPVVQHRPQAPAGPAPGIADADKWGPVRRVPLSQIRKTIATQMARSAYTIPHVTHCDEADITELEKLRKQLNGATGGDPKLTVLTFVIRALCIALRKHPIFNASFDDQGGQIIYKDYINLGIAVDTERGLIVPVIRNADQLNLRGIADALRSIADRVRTNQFGIEDLRGGTFTLTNVGALGGTFSTPIINYPEVAILGLGRSKAVPVLRNGQLAEALTLPINVSFDHRATDGANAARFTRDVISLLELPGRFLIEA